MLTRYFSLMCAGRQLVDSWEVLSGNWTLQSKAVGNEASVAWE